MRNIFNALICLGALWAAGLGAFVAAMPKPPGSAAAQAEAIVVLTGGSGRVEAALGMLAQGKAPVLFVSGVYNDVKREELVALTPEGRRYVPSIRAAFEKIIQCEAKGEAPRVLLSLATGSGKTIIAANLLWRLHEAERLPKPALFLCDRDELRTQGLKAMQNVFGADAAEVYEADGRNNAKNARVHVATYQTLGIDREDGDPSFLFRHYPEDYFSHIVIDECHRSAWGKWSVVLTRNPKAVQIGLTATPRQLKCAEQTDEARADARIIATLSPGPILDALATGPGGLARVPMENDPLRTSLQRGAINKDVWVLADDPATTIGSQRQGAAPVVIQRTVGELPSRAADDLFWLGAAEAIDLGRRQAQLLQKIGVQGYIVKPFTAETLKEKMSALLAK